MGNAIQHIVATYGYAAVFLVVGLESSGLPFIPGEAALISAAVYAATGKLTIALVILAAIAGAFLGANIGYVLGRTVGRELVERFGPYIRLDTRKMHVAERFFQRHGDKTVFVGRFIALLRALAFLLAGINDMPVLRFVAFNALGAVVWASLYGYLAFRVGKSLPLDRIGLVGIAVIVVGAVVLFVLHRRGLNLERLLLGEDETRDQPAVTT
jgi:membrane protein DedA with SNARE-associated domain